MPDSTLGASLRRDRYIRDRLRAATPPWRVEELTASDLAQGESLVTRLKDDLQAAMQA